MGEVGKGARANGEGGVALQAVALAEEEGAAASLRAVEPEIRPVVEALPGRHPVAAGEAVRTEQVAVVELEGEAVLVRDLGGIAASGAGDELRHRLDDLAHAAALAGPRGAPIQCPPANGSPR